MLGIYIDQMNIDVQQLSSEYVQEENMNLKIIF